jgi:hypothetical protein
LSIPIPNAEVEEAHERRNQIARASDTDRKAIPRVKPQPGRAHEAMSEMTDGGLGMGDELRASSQADDLAQIERDWMRAQARIDELTETGTQAIQRLVQDIINRAEGEDATPDQELAEA